MESGVVVFGQVMLVVVSSLAGIVGIGVGARFLWRVSSRVSSKVPPRLADRAELERLQNAVDAIAIEVERISEAQRFTVTLLSNRVPPAGPESLGELPRRGQSVQVDTPQ